MGEERFSFVNHIRGRCIISAIPGQSVSVARWNVEGCTEQWAEGSRKDKTDKRGDGETGNGGAERETWDDRLRDD